ncbi:MAG: glucokinase [Scytonema sp. PMC 1070.18]|nr:glucokinase [Scytonema sp. PMC 1070.18]
MYILAGEIGSKKSTFALFTHKKDDRNKRTIGSPIKSKTFYVEDYKKYGNQSVKPERNGQVLEMIKAFITQNCESQDKIYGACLGISGPIYSQEATIDRPNLKTIFNEDDIRQVLPCKIVPVSLLNDMEAIGYGIFLGNGEDQLEELSSVTHQTNSKDRRALMLVGDDGSGKACWYWDEKTYAFRFFSSEGGHTDCASRTDDEDDLLKMLREEKKQRGDLSPVSNENVLSEIGLVKIYQYLQKTGRYNNEFLELKEASQIIEKAQKEKDTLYEDALNMFLSIWGAEAGNLALWFNAQGGVYIGGSPLLIKILKLKKNDFLHAFTNKAESCREYNSSIPVKVFPMEDIVLWGAARFAIDKGFVSLGEAAYARSNK